MNLNKNTLLWLRNFINNPRYTLLASISLSNAIALLLLFYYKEVSKSDSNSLVFSLVSLGSVVATVLVVKLDALLPSIKNIQKRAYAYSFLKVLGLLVTIFICCLFYFVSLTVPAFSVGHSFSVIPLAVISFSKYYYSLTLLYCTTQKKYYLLTTLYACGGIFPVIALVLFSKYTDRPTTLLVIFGITLSIVSLAVDKLLTDSLTWKQSSIKVRLIEIPLQSIKFFASSKMIYIYSYFRRHIIYSLKATIPALLTALSNFAITPLITLTGYLSLASSYFIAERILLAPVSTIGTTYQRSFVAQISGLDLATITPIAKLTFKKLKLVSDLIFLPILIACMILVQHHAFFLKYFEISDDILMLIYALTAECYFQFVYAPLSPSLAFIKKGRLDITIGILRFSSKLLVTFIALSDSITNIQSFILITIISTCSGLISLKLLLSKFLFKPLNHYLLPLVLITTLLLILSFL